MTLRRTASFALAAAVAVGALAAAPGASAALAPPPLLVADLPGSTHVDPAPAGVVLRGTLTTSELVDPAAAPRHPARFDRGVQPLLVAAEGVRDVLTTPTGRPGLRGLVDHVAPSCTGTGTDGNRVQVLYAVEAGQPDRFDELHQALLSYVADVDDTFALSSRESGRRVRWVTDGSCVPLVERVVVPSGTLARPDMVRLKMALRPLGFTNPHRKYLVFADAAELCGIADVYLDDRRSAANRNNGGAPMYARVDTPCWAVPRGGHSTPAHELMHTLGAVQPSAPNGTAFGHCTDERDAMCYADGDGQRARSVCTQPDDEQLFDCRRDDYFDPRARPTSAYLRTHWNTADSSFLDRISAERNAIGLPPVAAITGPTRLRPGLAATLSVTADRPATVEWTSGAKACLIAPSGRRVRLQCPTSASGTVTVTASVTAEDGTVARVNQRLVLSGPPARMTVGLLALPEVAVGDTAVLRANVRYGSAHVHAVLALQQYAGRARGWVTLATATTDDAGQARFSVRRATPGARTYRVLVRTAGSSGWQTSTSAPRVIAVVTGDR
jgi:hypothetical protein